jgi:hypothetical protein
MMSRNGKIFGKFDFNSNQLETFIPSHWNLKHFEIKFTWFLNKDFFYNARIFIRCQNLISFQNFLSNKSDTHELVGSSSKSKSLIHQNAFRIKINQSTIFSGAKYFQTLVIHRFCEIHQKNRSQIKSNLFK